MSMTHADHSHCYIRTSTVGSDVYCCKLNSHLRHMLALSVSVVSVSAGIKSMTIKTLSALLYDKTQSLILKINILFLMETGRVQK